MLLCVAGCSAPTGRWQLVSVDPPGASFPFSQIDMGDGGTFRAKGLFTPQGQPTLKPQSTSGKLEQHGGAFHLIPNGQSGKTLSTHLRLDGKMVMTLHPTGRNWKVRGIFQRVKPVDPRLLDPTTPITPQMLKTSPRRTGKH